MYAYMMDNLERLHVEGRLHEGHFVENVPYIHLMCGYCTAFIKSFLDWIRGPGTKLSGRLSAIICSYTVL